MFEWWKTLSIDDQHAIILALIALLNGLGAFFNTWNTRREVKNGIIKHETADRERAQLRRRTSRAPRSDS
jgi:hypothetical protein